MKNLKYSFKLQFSIDNDYSTLENSDLNLMLSSNNLVTSFNFIEESGEIGDTNILKPQLSLTLMKKFTYF